MRIEIFGLPGVGKTYILNLLSDKYPDILKHLLKHKPSPSRFRVFNDFAYHIKHPFLYGLCNLEENRNALLLRFKRIAGRKKYIAEQNNCILTDSGIIQPLVEAYILSESFHNKINWIKLFDELIMDHCYFLINDSTDNIVLRELNRPSRIFSLEKDRLTQKYNKCQELINLMKKKMYLFEFSIGDYENTDLLVDDIHKKMVGFLNSV